MLFYSTNNKDLREGLKAVVMKGLPEDKGLYMPVQIPALPDSFIQNLAQYSLQEIALTVAENLLGTEEIPHEEWVGICNRAFTFDAPVVPVDENIYALELFHGPSLAFKDFGARFMAQVMSYFNRNEDKPLTILVATSGDTGGAVASGFYQTPGINIIILYPSGKVSPLQEKQLTALGHNITAIEIDGSFDDCQAIVKQAFLDPDISTHYRLSSANSINLARLVPQSFYYFEAYKQLVQKTDQDLVFCVPSGNFGNLTSGLMAKRMGLPIHHFIAATNINDVVPAYLADGVYAPRPSQRTLSNAMDVGAPSNFVRMLDLYDADWDKMKQIISGYAVTDDVTRETILELWNRTGYMADPHGAVGYYATRQYLQDNPGKTGVFIETAHPAKFLEDMESILDMKIPIPEALLKLKDSPKESVLMSATFDAFKSWMMSR